GPTQQGNIMSRFQRVVLCGAILTAGLAAQAALERMNRTDRPALRRPLATVPRELGDWIGWEQPVEPDIVERAQTTEYLSRVYESRARPGLRLQLLINCAREGQNPGHPRGVCWRPGGWPKIEPQPRALPIDTGGDSPTLISRLGYSRGELAEHVGFWYYIFGEGRLENYVRRLPITSRSSH